MKTIIRFYCILLIFYAIATLLYMLAGSHGRVVLGNKESLHHLGMVMFYFGTAIATSVAKWNTSKSAVVILLVVLNLVAIALISYQVYLLFPQTFTGFSIFILFVHFLGVMCAGIIVFKLITRYRQPEREM